MPVTIEIPTAFRRFTDGAPKVDCSANTIAEALTQLTTRHRVLHLRAHRTSIGIKIRAALRKELRLVVHVLTAAG